MLSYLILVRIKVVPGETALAFYTANNPTSQVITGIATYNVHPPKAGLYFNKIQCFCFEEQRLGPKEEVYSTYMSFCIYASMYYILS